MCKLLKKVKWDVLRNDLTVIIPAVLIGTIVVYGATFLGITLCPLKSTIGLPCPLCGGTRASILIMKFRFIDAFRMSPVVYLLGIFILIWAYSRYVQDLGKIVKYSFRTLIVSTLVIYAIGMFTKFPNIEPYVPASDYWLKRLLVLVCSRI